MKNYSKINFVLSQKLCKNIMKEYAKSFYFANKLLPKIKREAAYSIYGFCRYADNIVDNPRNRTIEEVKNEILCLKNELILAYKYKESEHPILSSFIYYAEYFKIPIDYPLDLLDGVLMDTEIKEFVTFEELYVYCYKVASVVGLMMCYILGFKTNEALIYAEKMGIAMQLTNILRDIKEDKNKDRIYIPIEDLNRFKVTKEQIIKEDFDINIQNLIQYYTYKAQEYYNESYTGINLLDKNARFSIFAAGRIYSEILIKIKNNQYNPFLERVVVSKNNKYNILILEILKSIISKK